MCRASRPSGRAAAVVLIALTLVLGLSGCLKIRAELTFDEDATVDGDFILAYNISQAEDTANKVDMTLEEWIETMAPESIMREVADAVGGSGAKMVDYKSGGYAGWRITILDGVPAAAAVGSSPGGAAVSLERQGDDFILTGSVDAGVASLGEAELSRLPDSLAEHLETAIYEVVYTFPGKVKSSSVGAIRGNQVIWRQTWGELAEVRIVASAKTDYFLRYRTQMLIGGGAALVIVVVVVVARLRRRRSAKTAGVAPPMPSITGLGAQAGAESLYGRGLAGQTSAFAPPAQLSPFGQAAAGDVRPFMQPSLAPPAPPVIQPAVIQAAAIQPTPPAPASIQRPPAAPAATQRPPAAPPAIQPAAIQPAPPAIQPGFIQPAPPAQQPGAAGAQFQFLGPGAALPPDLADFQAPPPLAPPPLAPPPGAPGRPPIWPPA
ncbi:MAG: hypothetical protein LBD77_08190 [Bifidobacteriaceae bacterium]|jgi:hypothetical protein|nr:hypothetical protein [Bifidobacteriaceae bacterium]